MCDVNGSDLTPCIDASTTADGLGIYINTAGTVAYLAGNGPMRRCPIKADGTFDTCATSATEGAVSAGYILVAGDIYAP